MQTFLPYPDFHASLCCLDYRRLGKQRVEAKQLIRALEGESTGWSHHPAAKMWRGHVDALKAYHNMAILCWVTMGYRNTMEMYDYPEDYTCPLWFGDPDFHASHRSNLLRKNPEHYGQFGWKEPPDLPYIWPVSE